MTIVAGVVSVQRGALATVHPIVIIVIVTIGQALVTIAHVTIAMTIDSAGAVTIVTIGAGIPVLNACHPGTVVVRHCAGVLRLVIGIAGGGDVVAVHVVGLRGHAVRSWWLAGAPREWLGFRRRHWLVHTGLGRGQRVVVRISVFATAGARVAISGGL